LKPQSIFDNFAATLEVVHFSIRKWCTFRLDYTDNSEIRQNNMKKVKITAIRKVQYNDLMAKYENPIEHTCDVREGQSWISIDGQCPEGLCPEAWKTMREFVEALARGEGNFYDGWMKNPYSAMLSCNDGFRPVSFYIETME